MVLLPLRGGRPPQRPPPGSASETPLNIRGPLIIRGALMGRFKLGALKIPRFSFSFLFVSEFEPLSKKVGKSAIFLFVLGRVTLSP